MNVPIHDDLARQRARSGFVSGLGAYLWWGVVPIYFKLLQHVPALAVVSHRVAWSLLFVAVLVTLRGAWRDVIVACRSGKTWLVLSASSLLIATNWLTFILSVQWGRVLDASLGYYIAPLVNVLLGVLFLHEKLRRGQVAALLLATTGVLVLAMDRGMFPWIALVLAFSFGFYGLLRKVAPVGPLIGLLIETALLLPPALLVIGVPTSLGLSGVALTQRDLGLLALAGVVTAVPLLLFANAARKLRLATIGFLQYVGPSVQFLLAVLLFDEPFGRAKALTFALIWTAVTIYSVDSLRAHRAGGTGTPVTPVIESATVNEETEPTCEPL